MSDHTQRVMKFLLDCPDELQEAFDASLVLADEIQREADHLRAELDTASAKYQHVLTERDDARAELEAAKVIVQAKSSGLTIAVFENHRLTKELEYLSERRGVLLEELTRLRAKVERYEKAWKEIGHRGTAVYWHILACYELGHIAREAVGEGNKGATFGAGGDVR